VDIKHFDFEQRNQHVNECIDRKLPRHEPASFSSTTNRGKERTSKIDDEDKDDFMDTTSPLFKRLNKNMTKKNKFSDENTVLPFASSLSVGSGLVPQSSSQGGGEMNLDTQISRYRSRLIEIEGQIAEQYYQRVQVNKEIKKLLKKQSLESQSFLSNEVNSLNVLCPLPMEDLMVVAFRPQSESQHKVTTPEQKQAEQEQRQSTVESIEYPLWSLSHQSSLFENAISKPETSSNQLLSVSHLQRSQQEPSLFSQLESAAQEVCDKRFSSAAPPKTGSFKPLDVLQQFEDLLEIVLSTNGLMGDRMDEVRLKIQENLTNSIELLKDQISLQTLEADHFTLPLEPEPVEHLTPMADTSFSQSLELSQSVVIVSDSDDLPSQSKAHSSPLKNYETLQISIEDSPISWRKSQTLDVVVDRFDLTSPPPSHPLPSTTAESLNQIDERPHFPLLTPPITTTLSLDILSSNELPSLSEYSLDQLKFICRSYGLKQSENTFLMIKSLTSLWNRHHHRSDQVSHSQSNHVSSEANDSLKRRIKDYLRSHEDLYARILSFQSIDLENLKQRLKEDGIVISKPSLRDLLDEEGVFVTSSTN
jgi:hypothetical protein